MIKLFGTTPLTSHMIPFHHTPLLPILMAPISLLRIYGELDFLAGQAANLKSQMLFLKHMTTSTNWLTCLRCTKRSFGVIRPPGNSLVHRQGQTRYQMTAEQKFNVCPTL